MEYNNVLILILGSGLSSRFYPLKEEFLFEHKLLAHVSLEQKIIDYIIFQTKSITEHLVVNTFAPDSTKTVKDFFRASRCEALNKYINNRLFVVNDDNNNKGSAAGLFSIELLDYIENHKNIEHIVVVSGDQPFAFETEYLIKFIHAHIANYKKAKSGIMATVLLNTDSKPDSIGVMLCDRDTGHVMGMIEKSEIENFENNSLLAKIKSGLSKSMKPRYISISDISRVLKYNDLKNLQDHCGGVLGLSREALFFCDLDVMENSLTGEKDAFSGSIGQILSENYEVYYMERMPKWITYGANTITELNKLIEIHRYAKI